MQEFYNKEPSVSLETALHFLLAEHELTQNERWRYSDRTWEVFRLYITLLTGSGGLIVALTSFGASQLILATAIAFLAVVMFVVGMTIFIQLLSLESGRQRVDRRQELVRRRIATLTSLQDYFRSLDMADAAPDSVLNLGYTPSELTKRVIKGAGLKTQVALINSAVGAIAIGAGVISTGVQVSGWLGLLCFAFFLILTVLHGAFVALRQKALTTAPHSLSDA